MDGAIKPSNLVSSDVGNRDGDLNVFKNKSDTKAYNLISILSTDPLLLSLLASPWS